MQIPVLETPELWLRPPDRSAAEIYERFYTDAQASAAYGGPISSGAAWARLASDLGSWHLQGFGVWVMQRKQTEELAGVCGFWQGLGWPRELTWWVLPEHRGRGLALQASRAAIAHAYEVFGWPSVQTYMNDNNRAARELTLKLGGQSLGRQCFPDGLEREIFHLPKADKLPPVA